jgi:ribosomal protein L35AE/L33A
MERKTRQEVITMDDNNKLFELNKYGKEIERPLNIVYNDKRVDIDAKELFDSSKFNTAYIVTYSSSYSYLVKLLEGFEHVFLVVGCEDSIQEMIGNRVAEIIDNTLFKDKNFAEKVLNNVIKIRYPPPSYTIHSKIYVLTNESGAVRVMFGSANLTPQALSGKHQIEELEVYDSDYNAEKCNEKLNRVKEIWDFCIDYKLSKEAEKVVKDKIEKGIVLLGKEANVGTAEKSIIIVPKINAGKIMDSSIFTLEEQAAILKEQIARDTVFGITPEEKIKEIEEQKKFLSDVLNSQIKEIEKQEKIAKEVLKLTKSKKYGNIEDIPTDVFAKSLSKIIQEFSVQIPKVENSSNFDVLLKYDTLTDKVVITKKDNPTGEIYAKEFEPTVVREQLERLNAFIHAYELFLQHPDKAKEVQKKMFEVILYSFMSPFIWKIRNEIFVQRQSISDIARVPPIMVIMGKSNAGKTKLLEMLHRMIGGSIYYTSYVDLLEIAHAKSDKKNLSRIFAMDTVSLFLVDEVTNIFEGSGESFLKEVANGYYMKPHPCMVCSDNPRYEIHKPDILKRIYYINLPTAMKEDYDSVHAEYEYLTKTVDITKFDNTLHRHFVYKVLEHLSKGDVPFYDINDPLSIGRHVFREMYEYAGLPKPDFISDTKVDDADDDAKKLWYGLYMSVREVKGAVVFENPGKNDSKSDRFIIFNFRYFSNLPSDPKQFTATIEGYVNKLPDYVVADSFLQNGIVRIRRKPFFEWLGKEDDGEDMQETPHINEGTQQVDKQREEQHTERFSIMNLISKMFGRRSESGGKE